MHTIAVITQKKTWLPKGTGYTLLSIQQATTVTSLPVLKKILTLTTLLKMTSVDCDNELHFSQLRKLLYYSGEEWTTAV